MAALIRMPRAVWKRQPQGAVDVNHKNPLAMGLVSLGSYINPVYDVLNNKLPTLDGVGSVPTVTAFGRGGFFDRVGNDLSSRWIFDTGVPLGAIYTVMAVASVSTTSVVNGLMGYDYAGAHPNVAYGRHLQFRVDTTAKLQTVRFNTITGAFIANSNQLVVVNRPYVFSLSCNSTLCSQYIDGNKDGSFTITGTPSSITNPVISSGISFITHDADAANDTRLKGVLFLTAIYSRALNDGENQELGKNPWQLFKPRIARFISIPSSGPVTSKIPVFMHHYRQLSK